MISKHIFKETVLSKRETENTPLKIYDFNGKKNICGERVKAARKCLALTQEQPAAKYSLQALF